MPDSTTSVVTGTFFANSDGPFCRGYYSAKKPTMLGAYSRSVLAVAAVAKSAVNVRTGPGVSFNKIDTLFSGESVDVTQCQDGWCYVEHSGPDGWVSGNYLIAVDSNGSGATDDVAAAAAIGIFATILGVAVSNAITPPNICFFSGINYTGTNLCVNAGAKNNKVMGFWNDKASSIKVQAGANVKVCRNWFYGGFCQTYNSNVPILIPPLNNNISSFKSF